MLPTLTFLHFALYARRVPYFESHCARCFFFRPFSAGDDIIAKNRFPVWFELALGRQAEEQYDGQDEVGTALDSDAVLQVLHASI